MRGWQVSSSRLPLMYVPTSLILYTKTECVLSSDGGTEHSPNGGAEKRAQKEAAAQT